MVSSARNLLFAVLFLAGALAVDRLRSAAVARAPSAVDAVVDLPALPAGAVRVLSLGFQSASADTSYLSAIQLYGDRRYQRGPLDERRRMSDAVARLLEYATDLDPSFAYAFVFGAVAIPLPGPDGKLVNAEPAIHLLRKGVAGASTDWRIPFHLGYLLSTSQGDYAGAAEAIAEAARRPGHPEYLPLLATRLAAHGGAVDTGLALARAMRDNAQTDEQRAALDERIGLLVMEQHLRAIEAAADRYRARAGAYPPDLEALVTAGDLPGIPAEPHGGSYRFDPATGQASSTGAARLRLFDSDHRDQERAAGGASEGNSP